MSVRIRFAAWLCVALSGCVNGATVTSTVVDDPAPLTSSPGDRLFTLALDTSDMDYAPSELLLTVQRPGTSVLSVDFELLTDVDANGRLGAGDVLLGREPPLDQFNSSTAGTTLTVELFQRRGEGTVSLVASEPWTAN